MDKWNERQQCDEDEKEEVGILCNKVYTLSLKQYSIIWKYKQVSCKSMFQLQATIKKLKVRVSVKESASLSLHQHCLTHFSVSRLSDQVSQIWLQLLGGKDIYCNFQWLQKNWKEIWILKFQKWNTLFT